MILVIDNYDSFVYNLVQYFGELGQECSVFRNDKITLAEAKTLNPQYLVVSPGPGNPGQAGVSCEFIRHFADKIPVFGICLGHQCIAEVFGGTVTFAPRLMHGKVSSVYHDGKTIYRGLPNPFVAARYHSLIVKEEGLPSILEISAHTSEGEIMGIRLKGTMTEGVQFHPESIMTVEGKRLIKNFQERMK